LRFLPLLQMKFKAGSKRETKEGGDLCRKKSRETVIPGLALTLNLTIPGQGG